MHSPVFRGVKQGFVICPIISTRLLKIDKISRTHSITKHESFKYTLNTEFLYGKFSVACRREGYFGVYFSEDQICSR